MKIAIDVDGVLADQLAPTLTSINDVFGVTVQPEEITTWDEDIPGTPTDIKTEIEAALEDPQFVREMPVIEGAVEAVSKLERDSHYIIIATNRPEAIIDATEDWLIGHGIPFDEIHSTEEKSKADIAADVLIDDYYRNLERFTHDGRSGILYQRPYNLEYLSGLNEHTPICSADGWEAVLDVLCSCD